MALTTKPSRRFHYFVVTEPSIADLLIHSPDGDWRYITNQTTTTNQSN